MSLQIIYYNSLYPDFSSICVLRLGFVRVETNLVYPDFFLICVLRLGLLIMSSNFIHFNLFIFSKICIAPKFVDNEFQSY